MKRLIWTISTAFFALLTTIFALTFIKRLNFNYNSEGIYFDDKLMTTYQQQAIGVYGIFTLLTFGITIFSCYLLIRNFKQPKL